MLVGMKISLFSANISLHHVLSVVRPSSVVNRVAPDRDKLWHSSLEAASFVDRETRTTKRCMSVNLVYDKKPRRYAADNRTEFNCTHCQICSWSN